MTTTTYELLKKDYPVFVSLPQAAEITGTHPSTWNTWQRNGEMPVHSVVIGGIRRIRLDVLCTYLDSISTTSASAPANKKRGRGRPRKVNLAEIHDQK